MKLKVNQIWVDTKFNEFVQITHENVESDFIGYRIILRRAKYPTYNIRVNYLEQNCVFVCNGISELTSQKRFEIALKYGI